MTYLWLILFSCYAHSVDIWKTLIAICAGRQHFIANKQNVKCSFFYLNGSRRGWRKLLCSYFADKHAAPVKKFSTYHNNPINWYIFNHHYCPSLFGTSLFHKQTDPNHNVLKKKSWNSLLVLLIIQNIDFVRAVQWKCETIINTNTIYLWVIHQKKWH